MTGIEEIATATVTLIAPFMPYLVSAGKTAGKQLVETIAEKGGEAAWSRAQALWKRISSHSADTPALEGVALAVATEPDDETLRAALIKVLSAFLQKQPQVAQELLSLIGGAESMQAVLIHGNSWGEQIEQNLEGPGTQYVNIHDGSSGKNITQTKK